MNPWVCPACGFDNYHHRVFCYACGHIQHDPVPDEHKRVRAENEHQMEGLQQIQTTGVRRVP